MGVTFPVSLNTIGPVAILMCEKSSLFRTFLVEHRAFQAGESRVQCAPIQVRERSPFVAARRLAHAHEYAGDAGYFVVYECGRRLAEFQGKDL